MNPYRADTARLLIGMAGVVMITAILLVGAVLITVPAGAR
jgi:hypothetical protein